MIVETLTCGSLLLLSLLLASNPMKLNIVANRWLSLLIFCIFCTLVDVVLSKTETYFIYPHLIGLSELFIFALAPSLYLSVIYFTKPEYHFKGVSLFHFFPCAIFLLYQLPYFFNDSATKLSMMEHLVPLTSIDKYRIILLTLAIKVQFLIYWILSFLLVRKHQKNIRLLASNLQAIHLQWLYYLLFFLLAMYLFWLNTVYFHIKFADNITAIAYLFASVCISYFALRQKEVFAYSEPVLAEINSIFESSDHQSYHERLSEEQIEFLKSKIYDFMITQEPYLDAGLTLPALSLALNYTVHDLSYVINKGFNQNFYQFINSFRLEKAKLLLGSHEQQHLNMVGIAFSCGFNSKTVFNTSFKKLTGLTPSEYKRTKS